MDDRLLTKSIKVLLLLVLLVIILIYAKPFLVPITFAALFSMLLLPLTSKLESRGINRGMAIFLSILLFIVIIGSIIYVFIWQVTDISKNASEIEQNINKNLQEVKEYISQTFGISRQKQNELIAEQQQSSGGKIAGTISGIVASFGSFIASSILTLVYVFLFLYFKPHLKKFILMLVPALEKRNAQTIIKEASGVAQKYITGLSWMILCLWIMYSIGFSIVGVKNAIFFAILCGLLEIVPFIGNLSGTIITLFAVMIQGGSPTMIIGVVITYSIIQFLQTYILEPLVVGKGVSINPLFTIAGIVVGELIWGIPGMILAIPLLGIVKIICDHIQPLKPFGFLIGTDKKTKGSVIERLKQWLH